MEYYCLLCPMSMYGSPNPSLKILLSFKTWSIHWTTKFLLRVSKNARKGRGRGTPNSNRRWRMPYHQANCDRWLGMPYLWGAAQPIWRPCWDPPLAIFRIKLPILRINACTFYAVFQNNRAFKYVWSMFSEVQKCLKQTTKQQYASYQVYTSRTCVGNLAMYPSKMASKCHLVDNWYMIFSKSS